MVKEYTVTFRSIRHDKVMEDSFRAYSKKDAIEQCYAAYDVIDIIKVIQMPEIDINTTRPVTMKMLDLIDGGVFGNTTDSLVKSLMMWMSEKDVQDWVRANDFVHLLEEPVETE